MTQHVATTGSGQPYKPFAFSPEKYSVSKPGVNLRSFCGLGILKIPVSSISPVTELMTGW
mgnify:CR=1 FL=1|jgi:hypothetical protein